MTNILEKNVAEIIIISVIMVVLMSSCGSSRVYHIGTGSELSKSNCSGNYIYNK
jgi:hypothetical protein